MAGFRIEGNTSGSVAEVTSGGDLRVALSNTAANIGGVRLLTQNDPGTLTITPYLKAPETSPDSRLRVGMDTVLFTDTFNATTQNTNLWSYAFVILTASQPGAGTLNFGTVQGTAATHGAYMRTFQYFPLVGTAAISVEVTFGQANSALLANEVWAVGLGTPVAAGTLPTDGVYLQLSSSGLIGVIAYSGTITQTGTLLALASLVVGNIDKYTIITGEREVEFWYNDIFLGELPIPAATGQAFQQAAQPVFLQKLCNGAVTNTNTMRVGDVSVTLLDVAINQPYPHTLSVGGRSGNIGQNGSTPGKTSIWTNNTAPTAVALTNTTAAFTGFGGIAAILPTLAVNTDGIIFSYQNPVPSINITGRNLVITGISIDGVVSVVLAGGPVIYAYAIAYGHTAVSLATAETGSFVTGTTHSPRIVPIGVASYAAAAAVGATGGGAYLKLYTPIVVRPGEFVQLIARNLGTVTTTGAITIVASFDAYFE